MFVGFYCLDNCSIVELLNEAEGIGENYEEARGRMGEEATR